MGVSLSQTEIIHKQENLKKKSDLDYGDFIFSSKKKLTENNQKDAIHTKNTPKKNKNVNQEKIKTVKLFVKDFYENNTPENGEISYQTTNGPIKKSLFYESYKLWFIKKGFDENLFVGQKTLSFILSTDLKIEEKRPLRNEKRARAWLFKNNKTTF